MTVPVLATSSVMVSVEWEMVHPQGDCTCVGYFQCDGECGVGDGSPQGDCTCVGYFQCDGECGVGDGSTPR